MRRRALGLTGLHVSEISLGAGPVAGVFTGSNHDLQRQLVQLAIERGINWFDTAATYGDGASETNLGAALAAIGRPANVHVATKVRIPAEALDDLGAYIEKSVRESLNRLQLDRVTLLQLHNSITAVRGSQPTSLTPGDVQAHGVLEAFQKLKRQGLVQHIGLTGMGDPESLREVIASGGFETIQIPFNLLNQSALSPQNEEEMDFGQVIPLAARLGMGVFAIRVYAGGALLGQKPSAHTLTTKFFPHDLYDRDVARAAQLSKRNPGVPLQAKALRFVLSCEEVSSAIIGFAEARHVDEAVGIAQS